jgi:uncharacterized membrane protein YeiB
VTPRGRLATRWDRLSGPSRVTGLDLARGLAVIGMLAAHLLVIGEPFAFTDPSTWVAVVEGRSSILFATLAGVSIGLMTGGQRPVTDTALSDARIRLTVRALLLWVIGMLLIFTGVPVYVILPAYAILFLVSLAFLPLRTGPLLAFAAVIGVVMPFVQVWLDGLALWRTPTGNDLSLAIGWHYPFTVWIAFVLAGLALARADVRRLQTQLLALLWGTALAVVGYTADAATAADAASGSLVLPDVWTAEPHSSGLWEVIGSGGFAVAVIAACLLLCRTVIVWIVLPIRAVGAMPLTAYTVQLVVWAIVAEAVLGRASDLSGFRALEPFWPMTLGLLVGCTAWALLIGRGPLEWQLDRSARLAVRLRHQ